MPSPFPGMDPYLEDPSLWRGFHHSLPEEIKAMLNACLPAKYYADVEVRTIAEEVTVSTATPAYPDVAVVERSQSPRIRSKRTGGGTAAIAEAPVRRAVVLSEEVKLRSVRIIHAESGDLVTSIEILSPFNKRGGEATEEYRAQRNRVLHSPAHLIEIDLLRGGERPGIEVREPPLEEEYVVLVNRAGGSGVRISEIWPIALSDPLPVIPVPLIPPDADVPLDLATALREVYTRSAYERRIDYRRPVPPPSLRRCMADWLAAHLPAAGSSRSL